MKRVLLIAVLLAVSACAGPLEYAEKKCAQYQADPARYDECVRSTADLRLRQAQVLMQAGQTTTQQNSVPVNRSLQSAFIQGNVRICQYADGQAINVPANGYCPAR